MKIVKNKVGQILSVKEVETLISIDQLKAEIESLTKMIDTFKSRISEIESTLKEVEKLEKQK
jgi:prefoldin subunit 5